MSYWDKMAVKMKIAQDLFLERFKTLERELAVDEKELDRLSDIFKKDADDILTGIDLDEEAKQCLCCRLSEHRETVRTALLFRAISGCLGVKALKQAAEEIKEDFAQRLKEVTESSLGKGTKSKVSIRYMLGDHFIKLNKKGAEIRLIFLNCPVYGVFSNLGYKSEGEAFCRLCEAHGKIMLKTKVPFRHKFFLYNNLCNGSGSCEFCMSASAPFYKYLLRLLPVRVLKTILDINEPKQKENTA